ECSLRKWLNEEFYESAFDESEKKMIKTYTIRNEENPRMAYYMDTNENVYETDEGNPTEVKVFPLTVDELLNTDYGFSADADAEDDNRKCLLTDYALAQGTNFYEKYNKNIKHYSQWGLRTVGYLYQAAVAAVHKNGDVSKSGHGKADISLAIRPAIYVTIA
ncbi:MAG: DUF6273 domain-containing protein, partial [Lachnospiraceae bacterium]|nr:DUF6273 domain-containing protein [Lachnospiraceae bacterium]